MSAISRIPALIAWISSPRPGAEITTTVCAACTTSTSSWPTPTVSIRMRSKPAASSTSTASRLDRARPPSAPRVAIERMKTPSSPVSSVIRTRSPRMAPPENGLDGSMATMPTRRPDARIALARPRTRVDLPLPGTPVMPITWALPALRKISARAGRLSGFAASASEIMRAMARTLPFRTPSSRSMPRPVFLAVFWMVFFFFGALISLGPRPSATRTGRGRRSPAGP